MEAQLSKNAARKVQTGSAGYFVRDIAHVRLIDFKIDSQVVRLLPAQLIRNRKVLPLTCDRYSITVAVPEPLNPQIIDDVRMATGLEVNPVYADEAELTTTIGHLLAFRINPDIVKIVSEYQHNLQRVPLGTKDPPQISIDDEAPIIRIVNALLEQAVQVGCSDIHIEAQSQEVRIRFRVDGELYLVFSLPKLFLPALLSRIKIMAGMDIAEKRLPQDGRFHIWVEEREVDFRVSTLPAFYGEKIVLRILDQALSLVDLEHLGLSAVNKNRMHSLCKRTQGLVLVTGSTGSGKTTTLYALLSENNSPARNIITLEDPIEYTLPGINQVQINSKAGLSFAGGLGSILRQDPDIIMVGEIRDRATAQLAVQAALTGHMVMSTLHTNSAAGTVVRLAEMGIEEYLLASSLSGVISQRLVRRLCQHCCRQYQLEPDTAQSLGLYSEDGYQFYHPVGCNMCRQLGYQGRMALQEIMLVGPLVRAAINRGAHADEVRSAALQEGMVTIKSDGIAKARQGLTSLDEVIKAVSGEE